MRNLFLVMTLVFFVSGCSDLFNTNDSKRNKLNKENGVVIKLENTFVTDEVDINVLSNSSGVFFIKITNISNKVLSKELVTLKEGDNTLTIHTKILPSSAYRIGVYDENDGLLVITDFNKL